MTADRQRARPGRLSIPLRTNIMTIFVLIFVAFSGFLVWFTYHQNATTALQAAEARMADIGGKVRERVEVHMQPLFALTTLTARLPGPGDKPDGLDHPMQPFLIEALSRYPQILSFYVGYGDGDFYQVQALAAGHDPIRAQLEAPDDTRFAIRRIRHDPQGGRAELWRFLDAEHSPVGERMITAPGYDPRERPWYTAALATDEVVATDLYVFASSRQVGLTVARRFDGAVSGVFGADVTLASLSDFVDSQRLSDATLLLVFDRAQRLVAHPDQSRLSRAVGDQVEAVTLADLGDPLTDALIAALGGVGGDARGTFEAGGEQYVGRITELPLLSAAAWSLALAVPVREFVGPIARTGTVSFLISLLATALVLPLLVLAARMISRPLNELVHEADAIREFRLDEPVTVKSRVREVQRLTESIATTKTALQTFGRYVPRALVKQLVQSGEVAEVGGQRRTVTLLFTDIADFTTIVEDMPPEALMRQISRYLEHLGGAILTHGGTIDKYIGDAIMAFWNAPLRDDDHARKACTAALACKALCHRLNAEWEAQGQPPLRTRFGLHTGEVVIGNIGSSDRMDYTAIGASVNLAARLEGVNKHYGTEILISDAVADAVGETFLFRPVDRVQPKGATRPVEIFELIGTLETAGGAGDNLRADTAQRDFCARWADAYRTYRARDWSGARDAFAALREMRPDDRVTEIYVARAETYGRNPPPAAWDGVEVFETK